MEDFGGIPWIVAMVGVVVLGLVLAYGVLQNRARRLSAGEKAAQRRTTAENFRVDEDSA